MASPEKAVNAQSFYVVKEKESKRSGRTTPAENVRHEFEQLESIAKDMKVSPEAIVFDLLAKRQPYYGIYSKLCPISESVSKTIVKLLSDCEAANRSVELLYDLYESLGNSASTYLGKQAQSVLFIRYVICATEMLCDLAVFKDYIEDRYGIYCDSMSSQTLRGFVIDEIIPCDLLADINKAGFFRSARKLKIEALKARPQRSKGPPA